MTSETLLLRIESALPGQPAPVSWQGLSLRVAGRNLALAVGVPDAPIRLADLVPPARQICDWLLETTLDAAGCQQNVPCRKGCSACCHYLVPLSVPEALRLPEELDALPAGQAHQTCKSFLAAAEKILQFPPQPAAPGDEPARTGQWYSRLRLPCPLLAHHACSLHQARPLACREHLVVSSPRDCRGFAPGRGQLFPHGLNLSGLLACLAAELEGRPPEAVMLPLALAWLPANAARASRTFHGPSAVSRLLALLEDQFRVSSLAA